MWPPPHPAGQAGPALQHSSSCGQQHSRAAGRPCGQGALLCAPLARWAHLLGYTQLSTQLLSRPLSPCSSELVIMLKCISWSEASILLQNLER